MRVVFVLGSGISVMAGMPDVEKLTRRVVCGDGVLFGTDQLFHIAPNAPDYCHRRPYVEPVLALIHDLRELAERYFGRAPNYEEISQVARQVDDALQREYESAAVLPLVEELVQRDYAGDPERLGELTELAHKYITDIVRQLLDTRPKGLEYLDGIVGACKSLPQVDLATLNHDLVLEAALKRAGISYADGFETLDEDVCFWKDDWGDASVRLLKLHGSLSWWGYQLSDEPWRGWVTARYDGPDPFHPRRDLVLGYPHDLRPIFLTGTFDKILAYERWAFPDQHLRFQEALREACRVVVIGYGFGDKAINSRLISWLGRAREYTLIICHGEPETLRRNARGAIQNKWENWQRHGQLAIVPKWVQDLDFADIEQHL